jgi:hypothetical protein
MEHDNAGTYLDLLRGAGTGARRPGVWLVTRTMERRPKIVFASYDRFFPSQDTKPLSGFGNLIAFQSQARRARG